MIAGVQRLLRVGRNVADLPRAVAFYRDALGFRVDEAPACAPEWLKTPGAGAASCARLTLGAQHIELTEIPDATPYPHDSSSADLWFQHCAVVVSDMASAYQRVIRHGAKPISRGGPQRLPPSSGSVTAFKFRDPDGHPLELIWFPPGNDNPVWQQHPNVPTLGIDHSAISVEDVHRSITFYELLGLKVAARGTNRGVEQQYLDGLDHVEVDVIALQPESTTPHVELLGYRAPRGRVLANMGIRDIAADQLVLQVRDLSAYVDTLRAAQVAPVGAGPINSSNAWVVLRDPDGHWLVLVE